MSAPVPDETNLMGFMHRVVDFEESDRETMHLLVFLLMQFLSRSDQVTYGTPMLKCNKKKKKKTAGNENYSLDSDWIVSWCWFAVQFFFVFLLFCGKIFERCLFYSMIHKECYEVHTFILFLLLYLKLKHFTFISNNCNKFWFSSFKERDLNIYMLSPYIFSIKFSINKKNWKTGTFSKVTKENFTWEV